MTWRYALRHPYRWAWRTWHERQWGPPDERMRVVYFATIRGVRVLGLEYTDPQTGEVWHAPIGSPRPRPWEPMPDVWQLQERNEP
jgi:hypothetical protein